MDKPDSSKYDYQSEPGVTDATYQDFVAPLLAGLGVGKIASAGAKALPTTANAVRTAITAAPAAKEFTMERALYRLESFLAEAQRIGDYARVLRYKALKAAIEQSQLSPDDVLNASIKIHLTN